MQNQVFKLSPSYGFTIATASLTLISAGIWLALPLSGWIRWIGDLVILAYGGLILSRYGLLMGSRAITAFWRKDERWCLQREDSQIASAILQGDSTVTRWICILRFKIEHQRLPVTCLVFADALPAKVYRRLLVLLYHARHRSTG